MSANLTNCTNIPARSDSFVSFVLFVDSLNPLRCTRLTEKAWVPALAGKSGSWSLAQPAGVGFGPVQVQAVIFHPVAPLRRAKVICAGSCIEAP